MTAPRIDPDRVIGTVHYWNLEPLDVAVSDLFPKYREALEALVAGHTARCNCAQLPHYEGCSFSIAMRRTDAAARAIAEET